VLYMMKLKPTKVNLLNKMEVFAEEKPAFP
jgi:hypothetical protein